MATTGLTMQSAVQSGKNGNPFKCHTYIKEASSVTGKSQGGKMPLPSDIPALPRQTYANCRTVKRTTTKSAHWDRKTYRTGWGVQCRKCNCKHAFCHVWPSFRNHTADKQKFPAARIHRQCNPKAIEVAFLTEPATEFFAEEQLLSLARTLPSARTRTRSHCPHWCSTYNLPLRDMWMFGITKSTSELTAVFFSLVWPITL